MRGEAMVTSRSIRRQQQERPLALLPWRPAEVERFLLEWPGEVGVVGTLSTTRSGDQGLIYRTNLDQAIVASVDFLSDGAPHDTLGYAAWAIARPLLSPIPRKKLLEVDPAVFLRLRGRRHASHELSSELIRLAQLAPFANAAPVDLEVNDVNDLTWVPAGTSSGWGLEAALRDAIASHRPSWRKLGFRAPPSCEVRVAGTHDRMDLSAAGIVVECKLDAGSSTLDQIDRYLARLRADEPATVGHIIVGRAFTRDLSDQVRARDDLSLWSCTRNQSGAPVLTRDD